MKHFISMFAIAALLLVPQLASAQIAKRNQCLGVTAYDALPCGVTRSGWYIDRTSGDMHLLYNGTEFLELYNSSTTLSFGGSNTTILNFDDNITMDGTLAVTGATTFTGTVTMNGASVVSPVYTITPTAGANKNFFGIQSDGTTYDATANALNTLHINQYTLNHTNVVAGGAYLFTADATGLDIGGGTIAENDNAEIFGNVQNASGRPFIVGTDAAFQFCATVYFADVSGSDAFFCGFREASAVPQAYGAYADCGMVGHISGDMYEVDEGADSDVDYTDWADTETKTLCTNVSAAGVVTYTVDGSPSGTPNAQTLTDGLMVVPFCNLLHDANLAENTIITNWVVGYQ